MSAYMSAHISAQIRKYMATYMGAQLLELLYTQFINLLLSSQPKKNVKKGLETLEIPSGIKKKDPFKQPDI